jgi:hypothetical protein
MRVISLRPSGRVIASSNGLLQPVFVIVLYRFAAAKDRPKAVSASGAEIAITRTAARSSCERTLLSVFVLGDEIQ